MQSVFDSGEMMPVLAVIAVDWGALLKDWWFTVALLVGLIVWLFMHDMEAQRIEALVAPLREHVDRFLNVSITSKATRSAYLIPAVVVLDKVQRSIHELTWRLPRELVPRKAEDVGTIVWLEPEKELVGSYMSGGGAYKRIWKLTFIDLKRSCQIVERTFVGGKPPGVVQGDDRRDHYGSTPEKEVIDFIRRLPCNG